MNSIFRKTKKQIEYPNLNEEKNKILNKIAYNLNEIKKNQIDYKKMVYRDLLKIKLEEYYTTFNELYPYIDVTDLYYEELIEDIDKCLKTKTKTNIVEESDVRNRFK
jgi:hypothetical protein